MIIDLSVTLSDDLPCDWPGLPPFSASVTSSFDDGDVFSRSLVIEEHCGTHADAPNHIALGDEFAARPVGIDAMPMDRFCGRARVADLRHITGDVKGESPWISPEDLDAALETPLRAGDVLLIRTGWSDERYQSFPAGERYVAGPLAGTEPGWPALHPFTVERAAYLGVRLMRGCRQCAPPLSCSPITPARTSPIDTILTSDAVSPSQIMPTSTVPAAPMPVQAA